MIVRRNERNRFIVYGKAQADISGLTLRRRIVDNKTRYYDIDIKISFQDGEYFFDTEKYLSCSSINKEYYIDIGGIENVEAISLPANDSIHYEEADIVFDVSENVIKYKTVPNIHASVTGIKTVGDKIVVDFFTDSKDHDPTVLFMRRSFTSRNGLYNKVIETKANGNSFSIPCSDLLKGKSEKGKEIWDVAIRSEKIGYIFINTEEISVDYCDKDSLISYKPFSSEGYLSIWTKEGENKSGSRIKVAILGSCYIKEAFHSLDFTNPDYKRFYDNVLVGFHHSFISLMSSPIDGSYDIVSKHERVVELYSENELKKNYLVKLRGSQAQYLLIDNYADATAAVVRDDKGHFFTENFYLKESNFFTDLIKPVRKYNQHEEDRIALYESAVKQFREAVKNILPLPNIILVRGRQSLYKEENGKKVLWRDHDFYEKSNIVWENLDNIFLKIIPEARQIDMRSSHYYSVEKTPLECSQNHFQSEYYRTLLNNYNKIVLSDMLREQKKFLTIVVPCYNAEKTISRCVESILRQVGSDTEIICVDDGSTDGTVKELLSYGERVSIIKKEHEGVSAARNAGMRRAAGKWIWFVDADDEILPGAVDVVCAAVKNENDVFCFGANVINNPNAEYRLDNIVLSDREINKDVFSFMVREYNKPFVWNCVYKKDFLKKNDIVFPEGQKIGEDMCFSMKVFLAAESVRLCSVPVYAYHYLEENGAMQKVLGTKERAVQHVKMVENILRESTAKGKDKTVLNEWTFRAIDPECFLYAETVRLLCPVWKKYHVKAEKLTLKKRLKCMLLRSKLLSELYILLKRRK